MIKEVIENQRRDPQVLIENKISFAAANSELSIYDTFEKASRVALVSDQLMFCGMLTGKKVMHANTDEFECNFLPHESFVMAPNHTVEIDFPTASLIKPTSCLAIEIGSKRVNNIISGLNSSAPLSRYQTEWQYDSQLVHTHHNTQTQALLDRIVQIYIENHEDRSFMIDLAVSELIVRLLRHQTRDFIISHCEAQPDHNGINAVVSHIKKNLEHNLDFDQLSKIACMSRTKLFTEFKQSLGCTPKDFLFQTRLKQAATMLEQGKNITLVCFSTGFKNSSHFSRSFKAFYGMSPTQYKNKH